MFLCEVISSNDMENDPSMNGWDVVCKNGLYFDENGVSKCVFNKEISISHDNAFRMKFEAEKASMNISYITPLEDCVTSVGSRVMVTQESHVDIPLVSNQMTHTQGIIYKSREIGKLFPPLILFEYVAFCNDPPFP